MSKVTGPNAVTKLKPEQLPFYGASGSDPNAVMKGDTAQQVPKSTAPQSRPKKIRVGAKGGYKLRR